jgi:hypothetical protein
MNKPGPVRYVKRELPTELPRLFGWKYELECGHVVVRRGTGRTWCYCEQCSVCPARPARPPIT